MLENYLHELYKLYTEPPFLTYEKLERYVAEHYKLIETAQDIRKIMICSFPNISEVKKENRKNLKGKGSPIFTKPQLQELYELSVYPPFLTYEELEQYVAEHYKLIETAQDIRKIMISNFSNISEVKKENRKNLKGKWNPIFTKTQLQELNELLVNPPYLGYKDLVEYSNNKFNIQISESKLRTFISDAFPDIQNKINEQKDEKYFYKDGTAISKEDKSYILELLAEGKTQRYIGNLLNISRSYVSRILKKSKLEIEDIKKKKILNKLNGIDISTIMLWWKELESVQKVLTKCIDMGCTATYNDIIYLLKEILHAKSFCVICKSEISFNGRDKYCSKECQRQGKLDRYKTDQMNRRVKGNGKSIQFVSKYKKIKEANGICYLCGEKLDTKIKDVYHPLYIVLDHVEALTISYDNSEDNLKAVCRCCNTLKSDKSKDFYSMEQYKNNRKEKIDSYIPKEINNELINKEQFKIDVENGMSNKDLCEKYNKSNYVITKTKHDLGLTKSQKLHEKLDKEYTIQEVARLTQQGKTIREIANILNIAEITVSIYRKRAYDNQLLERK